MPTPSVAEAPVCFGAITCFAVDSERCKGCAHNDACATQVKDNIQELAKAFNVEDLMARHRAAMARRKRSLPAADPGTLKHHAAPAVKNAQQGTATVTESTRQQGQGGDTQNDKAPQQGALGIDAPTATISIMDEMRRVRAEIAAVGDKDDILAKLQAGQNPFPAASRDLHILGEVLRKSGALPLSTFDVLSDKLNVSKNRVNAIRAFLLGTVLRSEGDALKLRNQHESLELAN